MYRERSKKPSKFSMSLVWFFAIFMILLSGVVYRVLASRLKLFVQNPIKLPVPLSVFPNQIGDWFGTEDQSQMNALTGHNINSAADVAIATQNPNFLVKLWRAISWDFSFLEGGLQIIRWVLFCLTAGAVFAIGQEFRSTLTSIFGRR